VAYLLFRHKKGNYIIYRRMDDHHAEQDKSCSRKINIAGHLWLTSVILATQETEIRRMAVQSQPQANSWRDPISKNPITKIGLAEWLKVKVLSSNPSTTKKRQISHVFNNMNYILIMYYILYIINYILII
jgi:hypothetical protein